jgi:uncharacterized protein
MFLLEIKNRINLQKSVFATFFALAVLLLSSSLQAQIPDRPNPPRLVNDLVGMLAPAEIQALEQKLVKLDKETGNQLAIVIVPTLGGMDRSEFAFELGQKWGVGQKGKDNGIVMLIKPKMSEQDRGQVFIATGYGLEGILPDAIVNRELIDGILLPYFREGLMFEGINQACDIIIALASKEFTAEEYLQKRAAENKAAAVKALLIFFFVALIFFFLLVVKVRNYARYNNNLGFWTAFLLLMQSQNNHSGHYRRFSSGGGAFGGGSGFGGGFGGFGGGSFGGGGAGGSW